MHSHKVNDTYTVYLPSLVKDSQIAYNFTECEGAYKMNVSDTRLEFKLSLSSSAVIILVYPLQIDNFVICMSFSVQTISLLWWFLS